MCAGQSAKPIPADPACKKNPCGFSIFAIRCGRYRLQKPKDQQLVFK
jgi:hypothetical protein